MEKLTDVQCEQLQWLLYNNYRIEITTPFGRAVPAKIDTYLGSWCWYNDTEDKSTRFHFSLVSKKDIKVFQVLVTEITEWDDYRTCLPINTSRRI